MPIQLTSGRAVAKPRRPYGNPVNTAKTRVRFEAAPARPAGTLTLPLDLVLPSAAAAATKSGALVLHAVGDTGGEHGTDMQRAVADAMEAQIGGASVDTPDTPAFFYHLGDVIYFNGQSTLYQEQFYEPYKFYPRDIFAIPGNHDGDTLVEHGDPPDAEPSLHGFVNNFCDTTPQPVFAYRDTMTQPYVYWTLDAPFVTIVGLYSNVDGTLDGQGTAEQQQWLEQQLVGADPDKCLLLTVHHPPYSLDSDHGGYPAIGAAIDRAMARVTAAKTGRIPDAILSGHVHDYQRFTRTIGTREIPYLIAGAGGYANTANLIHHLQRANPTTPVPTPFQTTVSGVVLESYDETAAGFLRVRVDPATLTIEYFSVPFGSPPPANGGPTQPGASATVYDPSAVARHDIVVVNLATHRLATNGSAAATPPALGSKQSRRSKGRGKA